MDADLLDRLAELVMTDPEVAGHGFVAATFVMRFGQGWANEFGFGYTPDGAATYWALESNEPGDLVTAARAAAPTPWRVLAVHIVPGAGRVEARRYYDADADAWFVPLGREDDLAELARPAGA